MQKENILRRFDPWGDRWTCSKTLKEVGTTAAGWKWVLRISVWEKGIGIEAQREDQEGGEEGEVQREDSQEGPGPGRGGYECSNLENPVSAEKAPISSITYNSKHPS
jgi:hypothetical protein